MKSARIDRKDQAVWGRRQLNLPWGGTVTLVSVPLKARTSPRLISPDPSARIALRRAAAARSSG